MSPLEPNDLLLHLHQHLDPWVKQRKGALSLAGDPGAVLDQLSDKPGSFRLILAWEGDEETTGQEEAGLVNHSLAVWVVKAKGLRIGLGDELVKPSPVTQEPPILELLSDVRARVRAIVFPTEDDVTYGRLLYKGAKPFPSPELAYELPTVGFVLRFQLFARLAEVRMIG